VSHSQLPLLLAPLPKGAPLLALCPAAAAEGLRTVPGGDEDAAAAAPPGRDEDAAAPGAVRLSSLHRDLHGWVPGQTRTGGHGWASYFDLISFVS
jgi:hypothetical protein